METLSPIQTVNGSINNNSTQKLVGMLSTFNQTRGAISLSGTTINNIRYKTTAEWDENLTLISSAGVIYIYSDHITKEIDGQTVVIPGLKVGDGTSYLIDLPFIDDGIAADFTEHILNNIIHVTPEDRDFWNNKVSASVVLNDEDYILVLSTD